MDRIRLTDGDISAILRLIRVAEPTESNAEGSEAAGRAQERAELQNRLAAGQISLETFARDWKRLQRPIAIPRRPEETTLLRARDYLESFGQLWRDEAISGELREEAARHRFERIDLWGQTVVAVHPRPEHAWLFGMAAKKSKDLELVGAKGFEPSTS